jgi:uncharacterized protein YdhG (YjbR/CyaY superfamily)
MKKARNVEEYIANAPKEIQGRLRQMRACIRSAAPGAKEELKWGMPAYSYNRILVMFAAFKHHIGFFPTAGAVAAFPKDLSKFKTGKGSIQFPHDEPLPLSLIRRITEFRARENKEKDVKWREKSKKRK